MVISTVTFIGGLNGLRGKSPMTSKLIYCSKCHKLAATIKENDDNVEVVQRGKTLIKLSKQSSSNISVRCPSGHNVRLEL